MTPPITPPPLPPGAGIDPSIKRRQNYNTILTILVSLSLAPWFFASFVSLFAFDAPGSQENIWIWCFVVPLWIYPLVALGGLCLSLIFNRRSKHTLALWSVAFPLIYAGLYMVAFGVLILMDLIMS